jgi:peptidoglycan/LPS O-acetylase OafA/YrhL
VRQKILDKTHRVKRYISAGCKYLSLFYFLLPQNYVKMRSNSYKLLPLSNFSESIIDPYDCKKHNSVSKIVQPILYAILPSFTTGQLTERVRSNVKTVSSTRWLNGMRGVASLIVVLSHLLAGTHTELYFGYGQGPSHHKWFLQLPIIRLLYGGNAMVAIFFVISGYAISTDALKYAHKRDWESLYERISSSALRRTGRLLIPTLITSFLVAIVAETAIFEHKQLPAAIFAVTARPRGSIVQQLSGWLREIWSLFDPWTWNTEIPDLQYGVQLWTIPVEWRCSMLLYLFIVTSSRLRHQIHVAILLFSQYYCMAKGRWEMFLFMFGMTLAQINAQQQEPETVENALTFPYHNSPRLIVVAAKSLFFMSILVTGLYLASSPEINSSTALGFQTLNALVPFTFPEEERSRFWVAIGASLIMFSVDKIAYMKRPFETTLAQYLGQISFSLYLVHNGIISGPGARLLEFTWVRVRSDSMLYQESGFVFGMVIILLGTVWIADLAWRLIDIPTLRLMKFTEAVCIQRDV